MVWLPASPQLIVPSSPSSPSPPLPTRQNPVINYHSLSPFEELLSLAGLFGHYLSLPGMAMTELVCSCLFIMSFL